MISKSEQYSPHDRIRTAVLISGGLDSAILLAESLSNFHEVHPLYCRMGLYWEEAELNHLRNYLEAVKSAGLQSLQVLDCTVADIYGSHWSLTGRNVPDGQTPDEAVYLPGRNVLLLSKALLWCHLRGVHRVALGSLSSNPFPDATPQFFADYQQIVNQAIVGQIEVLQPFSSLKKNQVMQRGRDLPLQWTFSCIQPVDGQHCGQCNKCAERRRAFSSAAMADPTAYNDSKLT